MNVAHRLDIFVLIDALGWRFLKDREFLSDLLPYRRPLRTVLGFSSGAIPTILTGTLPAQSGHWNLYYYDPHGSPFKWLQYMRVLPSKLIDNRVTRRLIRELGRHVLGLGPSFDCCVSPKLLPYFNWVEKRNIYGRNGISGAESIFDRLAHNGISFRVYSYHDMSDAKILQTAKCDLQSGAAEFYFLYLSEMDMFLHTHCANPAKINEQLAWYENGLRTLYATAAKGYRELHFTILSDHGMTPVRRTYDLMRDIEALNLLMPREYLVIYDSTMARFWFFSAEARQKIEARLSESPCGRILRDAELQELGVYFPDRRFGEVIFLLEPGCLLARSDFNGSQWMPSGMHGYHPDDVHSDAVFLSNVEPPADVHDIGDVYRIMEESLT